MTRSLLSRFLRAKKQNHTHPRARLNVESLEGRWVPSVVHVGSQPGEFTTIQQAINQANPGDTIMVDPGTYAEQLTIDTNSSGVQLDNLTIIADQGAKGTIVTLPSTVVGTASTAIVEITAAQNVTISNLTITGPGNSGSLIGYGIEVDGGGSAMIQFNRIAQIENNPLSGSQNGIAVEVGNSSAGQTGTATVRGNIIEDYQKNGIVVSNAGSSASIKHNLVIGLGPTSLIGQNGIEAVFGADAQMIGNTVIGNLYVPTTNDSTGILLYSPGTVTLLGNIVVHNDVGIYSFQATGASIVGNTASGNVYDGILLNTTTNSVIQSNTATGNGSYTHDVEDGNVDAGIALFSSTNNSISSNVAMVNTIGYYVDADSTGNSFTQNSMASSVIFGAEDLSVGNGTAGTANTWHANSHGGSNPPDLLLS